jgi:hypothetical protein
MLPARSLRPVSRGGARTGPSTAAAMAGGVAIAVAAGPGRPGFASPSRSPTGAGRAQSRHYLDRGRPDAAQVRRRHAEQASRAVPV